MKIGRQSKIIELIREYDIETQEELLELLSREGYQTTQATISRDIRELKLTKVPTASGHQKYTILRASAEGGYEKFVRMLQDGFLAMDSAGNILVIRTYSGMAMAVAAALDHLDIPEMVGCIAGDDTIMCAVRSEDEMTRVMTRINGYLGGEE